MSAETDITKFMDAVEALTPRMPVELVRDWHRLVQKLRTNLAAVSFLADRGEGYALDFLDEVCEIIRDRRSGLDVRIFEVLDAFDEFQREHLVSISPSIAVTRTDDTPIGRA
jgi:hypothetical protein